MSGLRVELVRESGSEWFIFQSSCSHEFHKSDPKPSFMNMHKSLGCCGYGLARNRRFLPPNLHVRRTYNNPLFA